MQIHCAHCNKIIEKDRYGEILCIDCETVWWEKIQDTYKKIIQKVINKSQ